MTDLFIKANAISDKATQSPQGRDKVSTLAGLAVSFQDLIHKAGIRIEDGFSALVGRAGTSAGVERYEAPRPADDYGRNQDNDVRDRFDPRDRFDNDVRSNDTGEDRSDAYRVEKDDGYGQENGTEPQDDGGDSYAGNEGADQGDGNEDPSDPSDTSTDPQASDDDSEGGEGDEQSAEAGNENEADGDKNSNQNETGQFTGATNEVLAGLIAGGEALSADGKASEQGKVSSQDGIVRATSNISNTGTEKAAAQGTENMSQTAVENISKTTPSSSGQGKGGQDNHQSQGQANAGDQAKEVAYEGSAIVAGTDGEDGANNAQVAGLAKAIGDGNRAQVTVTVNNESQNLTSKPSQALTANTVLSAESGARQANSQKTDTHTLGNSQNPTAQAQAQLAEAAQAQNQGAQGTQAGGVSKGLAQVSSVSSASGNASQAGGGEGVANAGGSNSTQQTQSQSAANQTDNAQKTFRTGHSMVEQISVKITKAILAGNDKITIRLRPANMGRVEVKMELSQDNHLTAIVTVDNRDTLEQLKNDSRSLQRALQEAGLQTNDGDLQFNMRGQEGQDQEAKGTSDRLSFDDEDLATLEAEIIDQPLIAADGTVISNGRVDIRA